VENQEKQLTKAQQALDGRSWTLNVVFSIGMWGVSGRSLNMENLMGFGSLQVVEQQQADIKKLEASSPEME
jgi:hypothetical protein